MDLIKDRKLRKNILHWYPIDEKSEILQIGTIPEEIIEELCEKSNKLTIVLEDEKERQEILEKTNIENLEIQLIHDFSETLNKQYDYVTLIGTLETYENKIEKKAYKRLEKILDFAKNSCKETGKILLIVDNKYGMKSWTTLKSTQNIICNQTYALSKTLIEKVLKDKNLNNYKYYYILPDYKVPNVIFTDEFLPNLESINRNFLYGEEEFENFNQTEAYIELLKENPQSFKFFANSYFIEIGKKELEENEIRFVSYTNIRKEKYKIQTIIYKDRVEKTYANEKSREHIENVKKNIEILNNQKINTLDKYENGKIISKYVENTPSYDKILIELLSKGKQEEFFESIQRYKQSLLERLEEVKYEDIKDDNIFTQNNIEEKDETLQTLHFVKYGLWDLIFHNTFFINNILYFYDQEWFDYNVPIEFIIYRAIAYFPIAHSYIKGEELYRKLGLEKYVEIFQKLDAKLQEKIRDEEIWNLHTSTKTGQTLIHLYKNLQKEFEEYKVMYNKENVDNKQAIIEDEKNTIEQLKKQVEILTADKEKIYNSTSWKLTKVVRWLGKDIKRKK